MMVAKNAETAPVRPFMRELLPISSQCIEENAFVMPADRRWTTKVASLASQSNCLGYWVSVSPPQPDTLEAKAELDRLHKALNAADDELAKIAPERVFLGWLESLGG